MNPEPPPKNHHQLSGPCCPLCLNLNPRPYFKDRTRTYLYCPCCSLVFVPQKFWLDPEQEKAVYDLHENHARDQGYLKFLSRIIHPLLERLGPDQTGLDFGCGPSPVLAGVLNQNGHPTDWFDLFYFNRPGVLEKTYDFITATEVVEHLQTPAQVFESLFDRLKPGGWLAIMTKMVIDRTAFKTWHYIRDLTHICFYSQATFNYLGKKFNSPVSFIGKDVIFFQKPPCQDKGTKHAQ